jgi:hypothetical protein
MSSWGRFRLRYVTFLFWFFAFLNRDKAEKVVNFLVCRKAVIDDSSDEEDKKAKSGEETKRKGKKKSRKSRTKS